MIEEVTCNAAEGALYAVAEGDTIAYMLKKLLKLNDLVLVYLKFNSHLNGIKYFGPNLVQLTLHKIQSNKFRAKDVN